MNPKYKVGQKVRWFKGEYREFVVTKNIKVGKYFYYFDQCGNPVVESILELVEKQVDLVNHSHLLFDFENPPIKNVFTREEVESIVDDLLLKINNVHPDVVRNVSEESIEIIINARDIVSNY